MLDQAGEGNRHPEVGAISSKISPILAYVVSMAVPIRSCMEVTPVEINGGGRLRANFYADNANSDTGPPSVHNTSVGWLILLTPGIGWDIMGYESDTLPY